MKWFKFYGQDFLTDSKLMELNYVERLLWVTILCLASIEDKDGNIPRLTEEKLFKYASLQEPAHFQMGSGILQKLVKYGMIQNDNDDNEIRVINFKKRQNKNLSGYERVKRYRAKKASSKAIKNDNDDNIRDNANDNARIDKNRIDKNIIHFDQFWREYPRKVSKSTAQKSWSKIKPDELLFEAILESVKKHKLSDQWVKNDGQFIPHPSTWLNQRRWEDEISSPLGLQQVSVIKNS